MGIGGHDLCPHSEHAPDVPGRIEPGDRIRPARSRCRLQSCAGPSQRRPVPRRSRADDRFRCRRSAAQLAATPVRSVQRSARAHGLAAEHTGHAAEPRRPPLDQQRHRPSQHTVAPVRHARDESVRPRLPARRRNSPAPARGRRRPTRRQPIHDRCGPENKSLRAVDQRRRTTRHRPKYQLPRCFAGRAGVVQRPTRSLRAPNGGLAS